MPMVARLPPPGWNSSLRPPQQADAILLTHVDNGEASPMRIEPNALGERRASMGVDASSPTATRYRPPRPSPRWGWSRRPSGPAILRPGRYAASTPRSRRRPAGRRLFARTVRGGERGRDQCDAPPTALRLGRADTGGDEEGGGEPPAAKSGLPHDVLEQRDRGPHTDHLVLGERPAMRAMAASRSGPHTTSLAMSVS